MKSIPVTLIALIINFSLFAQSNDSLHMGSSKDSLHAVNNEPSKASLYIVIDGIPSSQQELETVQHTPGTRMFFLSPVRATELYGVVASHGALIVTTKQNKEGTLTWKKGIRNMNDSISHPKIKQVEVVKGHRSLNRHKHYGQRPMPRSSAKNILIHIANSKDKSLKDVIIYDKNNNVLATTDKCGNAYIENFSLKNIVLVKYKNYPLHSFTITDTISTFKLE